MATKNLTSEQLARVVSLCESPILLSEMIFEAVQQWARGAPAVPWQEEVYTACDDVLEEDQ